MSYRVESVFRVIEERRSWCHFSVFLETLKTTFTWLVKKTKVGTVMWEVMKLRFSKKLLLSEQTALQKLFIWTSVHSSAGKTFSQPYANRWTDSERDRISGSVSVLLDLSEKWMCFLLYYKFLYTHTQIKLSLSLSLSGHAGKYGWDWGAWLGSLLILCWIKWQHISTFMTKMMCGVD